jgi:hypothetical protein
MNAIHCRTRGVLAACAMLVAVASPASSQGKLDADTFKHYGGTFLSDCGNNASPRVTLFEDAIVFLQGNRRIAASNLQPAASWYGNSPPEGHLMTFLSATPDGKEIMFEVYENEAGRYVLLAGDAIDPSIAFKMKFFACDGAGKKATTAAVKPVPAPPPSEDQMDAAWMLTVPKFKAAYLKALGARAKTPWLAKLDGPNTQAKKVTVAGKEYLLFASCKAHECDENNLVLLWSAPRGIVYGMIHQEGKSVQIGGPPPAVAKELGAQWRAVWRSQP